MLSRASQARPTRPPLELLQAALTDWKPLALKRLSHATAHWGRRGMRVGNAMLLVVRRTQIRAFHLTAMPRPATRSGGTLAATTPNPETGVRDQRIGAKHERRQILREQQRVRYTGPQNEIQLRLARNPSRLIPIPTRVTIQSDRVRAIDERANTNEGLLRRFGMLFVPIPHRVVVRAVLQEVNATLLIERENITNPERFFEFLGSFSTIRAFYIALFSHHII